MEEDPTTQSKKRSMAFLNANELSWKFKSKQDIVTYLDQHGK